MNVRNLKQYRLEANVACNCGEYTLASLPGIPGKGAFLCGPNCSKKIKEIGRVSVSIIMRVLNFNERNPI